MEVTGIAQKRAAMPSGTNKVLDRRTLEKDNKSIIPFLKPGMTVLDVGCGSGFITKGIAERVGPEGKVIGMDPGKELIAHARENHKSFDNLSFIGQDIFEYRGDEKFDLVTCSRTLQWLSSPLDAIFKMKSLLKPGAVLSILDYNHEKILWSPAPTEAMKFFYGQFMAWREDAGMNNRIADDLAGMLSIAGLKRIVISDESELSLSDDESFRETAGIWIKVAESRGKQMIGDGYINEIERLTAIEDYFNWINTGNSMKMYLLGVSGYNE